MGKSKAKTTYLPTDYDSNKFYTQYHEGKRRTVLMYGARTATQDQIRYYNYFTDEKGVFDTSYQRPADAPKPKSYYTAPKKEKTPKPQSTPKANPITPKASDKHFSIDKNTKSYFPRGTDFYEHKYLNQNTPDVRRGNQLGNHGWGRSLALKRGEMNYTEARYYKPFGKNTTLQKTTEKYGEFSGGSNKITGIIRGHDAFMRHLDIVKHQIKIQIHNFKVAVGKRAVKVFQDSFDMQKFNSAEASPWAELASFTMKKRKRRGTYPKKDHILREYLDLRNSIKDGFHHTTYRVETKPIQASVSKHKKRTGVWAALHNEGIGTYGKGFGGRAPKPYIQRKFMGHSTRLDIYSDRFMQTMARKYLFDSVFLIQ